MHKVSCVLLILMIFFSYAVKAEEADKLCLRISDSEVLKQFSGTYISSDLILNVKKNKSFFKSFKKASFINEISISEQGKVSFSKGGWHEGWTWDALDKEQRVEECISVIDKNTLIFRTTQFMGDQGKRKVESQYTRISPMSVGRFFFGLLFQGCFKGPENNKWCFTDGENKSVNSIVDGKIYNVISLDGKVLINGRQHIVEFVLDRTELPQADAILRVEGEKLFWAFYKTDSGLRICKTEPITTENYKTELCQNLIRD